MEEQYVKNVFFNEDSAKIIHPLKTTTFNADGTVTVTITKFHKNGSIASVTTLSHDTPPISAAFKECRR